MNKIKKDICTTLLIVLLLNIVSYFIFFRWDFTSTKRYSLSKVSKDIVQSNQKPIVIDFYVTENLPQDIQKLANEFLSLLKEYKSLSRADFTVNTIVPNTKAKEFKATKAGIEPIYKEIRNKEFEKIQRIFIGAIFHIGNQEAVISNINFDTPMEYEITRLIKQANDARKPTVGFVQGHGESRFSAMPQFMGELAHLSQIQHVRLDTSSNLNSNNVICIIDPQDSFTADELAVLERYLKQGGRLFIALNHAVGQLGARNSGFINRTGIEDMLEKKGLKIRYDFIIDNNCGTIAIHQQYGLLNFQSNISFPYIPIITNFSRHTITYGLNSLLLPFASSIEQIRTSEDYSFSALARTSAISGIQQAPIFFDLQRQWTQRDFNHPNNIVAALLTNKKDNSAIITITDADFIKDDIVTSGPTDNINFAINSIEWLADNSGLIQLRNKFTTFSTLEPINEQLRNFLKYLNFSLPITAIIIAALLHYRHKKRIRLKRMQPGSMQ